MHVITDVMAANGTMTEGLMPVLVGVDSDSSERTAAIITVGWLGNICNLYRFRKLADKFGTKSISDSSGALNSKPPVLI